MDRRGGGVDGDASLSFSEENEKDLVCFSMEARESPVETVSESNAVAYFTSQGEAGGGIVIIFMVGDATELAQ